MNRVCWATVHGVSKSWTWLKQLRTHTCRSLGYQNFCFIWLQLEVPMTPSPWDSVIFAPLVAQLVKNPPAMQETPVQFLRQEDPLEKWQATPLHYSWASLMAQLVKNPPAMWDAWVLSLGLEDPLEEGIQPTPVFLPGESPWTEEPGRLQSKGSQRVRHDWAIKHSIAHMIWSPWDSVIFARIAHRTQRHTYLC